MMPPRSPPTFLTSGPFEKSFLSPYVSLHNALDDALIPAHCDRYRALPATHPRRYARSRKTILRSYSWSASKRVMPRRCGLHLSSRLRRHLGGVASVCRCKYIRARWQCSALRPRLAESRGQVDPASMGLTHTQP